MKINRHFLVHPCKILSIISLCILLSSCQQNSSEALKQTEKTTVEIKPKIEIGKPIKLWQKGDTLKVDLFLGVNTYFFHRGEELGMEVELLKLFCQQHGIPYKIVPQKSWQTILARTDSGLNHIGMLGYSNDTSGPLNRFPKVHSSLGMADYKIALFSNKISRNNKKLPPILLPNSIYERAWKDYAVKNKMDDQFIPIGDTIDQVVALKELQTGKINRVVMGHRAGMLLAQHFPDVLEEAIFEEKDSIRAVFHERQSEISRLFNRWISQKRRSQEYAILVAKYKPELINQALLHSVESNLAMGKPIPFEKEIKSAAAKAALNWLLLASLIQKETGFNPKANSWAKAIGLMAITPVAAKQVNRSYAKCHQTPYNLETGCKIINWLDKQWIQKGYTDSAERVKFVLASYNAGIGHVEDAIRLSKRLNKNPKKWFGNVEVALSKLDEHRYNSLPEVYYGYCHAIETTTYVTVILKHYQTFLAYSKALKQ